MVAGPPFLMDCVCLSLQLPSPGGFCESDLLSGSFKLPNLQGIIDFCGPAGGAYLGPTPTGCCPFQATACTTGREETCLLWGSVFPGTNVGGKETGERGKEARGSGG